MRNIVIGFAICLVFILCIGAGRYQVGKFLSPDIYTQNYDPNDPIYRYIPPAESSWIEQFGDNERTRLLHSISEIRVVVAAQSKRLFELESRFPDVNGVDPNE